MYLIKVYLIFMRLVAYNQLDYYFVVDNFRNFGLIRLNLIEDFLFVVYLSLIIISNLYFIFKLSISSYCFDH